MAKPDHHTIKTMNGEIQVSLGGLTTSIGLLVERDGEMVGTLLTPEQAQKLSQILAVQNEKDGV